MPQFIDYPADGQLKTALPVVTGWFATDADVSLDRANMHGPSGPVSFRRVPRPDVEALFPGHHVLGFTASLDKQIKQKGPLSLSLTSDSGVPLTRFEIEVTDEAEIGLQELASSRARKRQWCLRHLRCPLCKCPDLKTDEDTMHCPKCRSHFPQTTGALNFLPPELYRLCSLDETSNVSSNGYDQRCFDLIAEVSEKGGKILDCGAGFRVPANDTVINAEIVDFPSTDVLAVGQSLPFRDGSFDAVFSFAVLEHVSDPFTCSRELVRVVKPGGQIYCHVPFLQPEHGFPHHFYNMTRQGLLNLFPDLHVELHEVPPSGYPMFGLRWIVERYAQYLPPGVREKFLAMPMSEILSRGGMEWNSEDIVSEMSEEGRWVLACTTAILLRKPG